MRIFCFVFGCFIFASVGRASTNDVTFTKDELAEAERETLKIMGDDLKALSEGKKTNPEVAKLSEKRGLDLSRPPAVRALLLKGALSMYVAMGDTEGVGRVSAFIRAGKFPEKVIEETLREIPVDISSASLAEGGRSGRRDRYGHREIRLKNICGLSEVLLSDTNKFPKVGDRYQKLVDVDLINGLFCGFSRVVVYMASKNDRLVLRSVYFKRILEFDADDEKLEREYNAVIQMVAENLGIKVGHRELDTVEDCRLLDSQGNEVIASMGTDMTIELADDYEIRVEAREASFVMRHGQYILVTPASLELSIVNNNGWIGDRLPRYPYKRQKVKVEREIAFGPNLAAELEMTLRDLAKPADDPNRQDVELRRLIKSAEAGSVRAMNHLARKYHYGSGVKCDQKLSFKYSKMAADKGDADGISGMAECYESGRGVARDPKMAAELFKRAALLGDDWAMCRFGKCLAEGIGVSSNAVEALKWFKKGANGGCVWGKMQVAKIYLGGVGVARDESEARKWLERVEVDAVEGKLDACHMLCELYMDGYNGVGRDPARAFKYSQMGVAQKFPWGVRRLARCYAEGLGTPKDIGKARECLHRALENCGSNQKVKSEIEAELKNLK